MKQFSYQCIIETNQSSKSNSSITVLNYNNYTTNKAIPLFSVCPDTQQYASKQQQLGCLWAQLHQADQNILHQGKVHEYPQMLAMYQWACNATHREVNNEVTLSKNKQWGHGLNIQK